MWQNTNKKNSKKNCHRFHVKSYFLKFDFLIWSILRYIQFKKLYFWDTKATRFNIFLVMNIFKCNDLQSIRILLVKGTGTESVCEFLKIRFSKLKRTWLSELKVTKLRNHLKSNLKTSRNPETQFRIDQVKISGNRTLKVIGCN